MRHISTLLMLVSVLTARAEDRPSLPRTRVVIEGQSSIVRLGPHFTTTIRLPEAVNSVALGDPALFQAEHSSGEPMVVFVKPLTLMRADTNLSLTTISGRHYTLILTSSGDAGDAGKSLDLLVECRPAKSSFIEETFSRSLIAETVSLLTARQGTSEIRASEDSEDSLSVVLKRQQTRQLSTLQGDRLRVGISEIIERGGRFLVVFSVFNSAPEPVELMPPQVQLAGQTRSGSVKKNSRWTTVEQIPAQEFRLTHRRLEPGARSDGLVLFNRPPMKQSNEGLLLQVAESAAVDLPVLVPFRFSSTKLEDVHE